MDYTRILLTIIVGSVSGILGGAFGFGGSFIMLPGVLLLGIIPNYKTAVGTILLSLLPPISLLAVMDYYRKKQVDTVVGIILFVSYFFAAYYGSLINAYYSTKVLKYCTSFVFFILSIYFLMTANQKI